MGTTLYIYVKHTIIVYPAYFQMSTDIESWQYSHQHWKWNIKLQGIIATQKHQLRQHPITNSCPVRPQEQPTVTKIHSTGAEVAGVKICSQTSGAL